MNRQTSASGFSSFQIIVLLFLIVLVCMVFGGLVFIIFSMRANTAVPPLATQAEAQVSPTPQPTYTFIAMAEPTATATPLATSTPIPDWQIFTTSQIEISLPENYGGGDPGLDLDKIVSGIKAIGGYNEAADQTQKNLTEVPAVFYAFDTRSNRANTLTYLTIYSNTIDADTTIPLDELMDEVVKTFPPDYRVVDRRIDPLDYYEAGRMFVEYRVIDGDVTVYRTMTAYIIRTPTKIWELYFRVERSDFKDQQPLFDLAARSFHEVLPVEVATP